VGQPDGTAEKGVCQANLATCSFPRIHLRVKPTPRGCHLTSIHAVRHLCPSTHTHTHTHTHTPHTHHTHTHNTHTHTHTHTSANTAFLKYMNIQETLRATQRCYIHGGQPEEFQEDREGVGMKNTQKVEILR